jgi:hypothetical protein
MPSEMDSWAREIKSYQEVPEEFKKVLASFETGQSRFPYTLYAPPDKWGLRKKTHAKLIVIFDHKILFAEKVKNGIVTQEFEFENVNYIERGTLLLYSWIRIVGMIDNNIFNVVIEFNSVVKHLFEQIIKSLRISLNNIALRENAPFEAESQKFDYLMKIDYKYMNYSRDSIIPGERVCSIIYQPVVSKKDFIFFTTIKIFPCSLVLTENELIVIHDEERQSKSRYGGIWTYIPIRKIIDLKLDVDSKTNDTNLNLSLLGNDALHFKFSAVEAELKKFMDEFFKARKRINSSLADEINRIDSPA